MCNKKAEGILYVSDHVCLQGCSMIQTPYVLCTPVIFFYLIAYCFPFHLLLQPHGHHCWSWNLSGCCHCRTFALDVPLARKVLPPVTQLSASLLSPHFCSSPWGSLFWSLFNIFLTGSKWPEWIYHFVHCCALVTYNSALYNGPLINICWWLKPLKFSALSEFTPILH